MAVFKNCGLQILLFVFVSMHNIEAVKLFDYIDQQSVGPKGTNHTAVPEDPGVIPTSSKDNLCFLFVLLLLLLCF